MTRFLAAILFVPSMAWATTFSTDVSDLWWNPSESGWGLNASQQSDIIFFTAFVYDANGQPTWFVGPSTQYSGTSGTTLTYSGPWYRTTGPYYGAGSFDPNAVGVTQVGTITFALLDVNTAAITYTVNGVTVNKVLTRETWRTNDLVGDYMGGAVGTYSSGCAAPGYLEQPGTMNITQTASGISMDVTSSAGTCTYNGDYTQYGRLGTSNGTFSCTNGGGSGTYSAFEIEGTFSAVTFRAAETFSGSCTWNGRIGGLRRGS